LTELESKQTCRQQRLVTIRWNQPRKVRTVILKW